MTEFVELEQWQITLAENAERGAKLLDEVEPGWYNKIFTEDLDISRTDLCICGQVFKDRVMPLYERVGEERDIDSGYDYFMARLVPEDEVDVYGYAAKHGFETDNVYHDEPDKFGKVSVQHNTQYGWLADMWIPLIEKRKANDGKMLDHDG